MGFEPSPGPSKKGLSRFSGPLQLGLVALVVAGLFYLILASRDDKSSVSNIPTTTRDVSQEPVLTFVPNEFRHTCTPGAPVPRAISIVACNPGAGVDQVAYAMFSEVSDMNAAYEIELSTIDARREGSAVRFCAKLNIDYTYQADGQQVGRYVCTDDPVPTIIWTTDSLRTLSIARGEELDDLIDFWSNRAGPKT